MLAPTSRTTSATWVRPTSIPGCTRGDCHGRGPSARAPSAATIRRRASAAARPPSEDPMGFHHVAIATRDLAATHRFYTEAMGFELAKVVAGKSPEGGWAKHV